MTILDFQGGPNLITWVLKSGELSGSENRRDEAEGEIRVIQRMRTQPTIADFENEGTTNWGM